MGKSDWGVERFFDSIIGLRFIQIGAYDGVYQDPVRYHIKHHGWRGVLVEPQPDMFQKLVKGYEGKAVAKNLTFVNVAISDHDGTQEMCVPERRNIASFTLHDRKLRIAKERGLVNYLEVRTLTLKSFLDKYWDGGVDVLFVDAEGCDFDIIKQIDFDRIRPRVIQYEHVTIPRPWECAEFLNEHGYYIHIEDKLDAIAYERTCV